AGPLPPPGAGAPCAGLLRGGPAPGQVVSRAPGAALPLPIASPVAEAVPSPPPGKRRHEGRRPPSPWKPFPLDLGGLMRVRRPLSFLPHCRLEQAGDLLVARLSRVFRQGLPLGVRVANKTSSISIASSPPLSPRYSIA